MMIRSTYTRGCSFAFALSGVLPFFATSAMGFDAHSYVTTGLVAQWDGIDNVGTGTHDPTSTTWRDLTGHGYDAKLNNQETTSIPWANGNSMRRQNLNAGGTLNAVKVSNITLNLDSSFTFDFCGVRTTKNSGHVLWFSSSTKRAEFELLNTGIAKLTAAGKGSYNSGQNLYTEGSLIAIRDGTTNAHYNVMNNTSWVKVDGEVGTLGNVKDSLFLGSNSGGNSSFLGNYHALRIYNRPLTADERKWNTMIDQIRFFGASADETTVEVESLPSAWGLTGTPALGSKTTVANTGNYAISLAGLSEHPDDGALSREYATGCRARFHGWSFTSGMSAFTSRTTGTATNGTVVVTNIVAQLAWDVRNEMALSASARTGGKVRVDGCAAVAGGSFWMEEGTCAVEAVPDEGYVFAGWTGDVAALGSAAAASTTCDLHAPTAITATFVEAVHEPTNVVWSGSAAGEWNDSANWDVAVPGEGDTVTLEPAGAADTTVVLDTPTAALASLVVRGKNGATMTLVVSNWMSRVSANSITVGDGGSVAVVGAFTDAAMSNRVWLAGTTLTVESGGAIRADAAGYAGQNGPAWRGVEPTANKPSGKCDINVFGGSYGGRQGAKEVLDLTQTAFLQGPRPYGSAAWPFDPGSGAGYVPQAAGGAIYLDFSGAVTINGEITADANMTLMPGGSYNVISGHGSGGGIVIVCSSISGSGKVTANSTRTATGVVTISNVTQAGGGGGGGRIAVHYDTTAQNAAACDVVFEAFCKVNQTGTDEPCAIGEPGTVWFTDNRFIESGRVFDAIVAGGVDTVNIPGNSVIGAHRTGFDPSIRTVNFGGDLSVTGTIAKMSEFIMKGTDVSVAGNLMLASGEISQTGGKLEVAGNLTMTNALPSQANARPKLHAYAPVVAGQTAAYHSVTTKVCGVWRVGSNASVYPYVDDTAWTVAAAVPYFEATKLIVEPDGLFDARERGWGWSAARGADPTGIGCGGMKNPNDGLFGASHGGRGAGDSKGIARATRTTYGSATEPLLPGSSAKASLPYQVGGLAGGVIRIVADRIALDGSLLADGQAAGAGGNGGSGGSIWVTAYRLSGSGTMTANGGSSAHAKCCYGGGGGRIAIYACRNSFFDPTNIDSNRVSVTAGSSNASAALVAASENGTIYFGQMKPRGTTLIIR